MNKELIQRSIDTLLRCRPQTGAAFNAHQETLRLLNAALVHTDVTIPELPGHPEPRMYDWSELERKSVAAYGSASYQAGHNAGVQHHKKAMQEAKSTAQPAALTTAERQHWELLITQAMDIRELLDLHAPETEGNLRARITQVLEIEETK